jgi:hypothetical protein
MPAAATPRPSFSVHSARGLPQPGQLSGNSSRSLLVIAHFSSIRLASRSLLRSFPYGNEKDAEPDGEHVLGSRV